MLSCHVWLVQAHTTDQGGAGQTTQSSQVTYGFVLSSFGSCEVNPLQPPFNSPSTRSCMSGLGLWLIHLYILADKLYT